MPSGFARGTRIGFDLLARPVVRIRGPHTERAGGRRPRTMEVDIHERATRRWAAASRGEAPLADRVYREWLARKPGVAARIKRFNIRRVEIGKAWRGQSRASRTRAAVLHGELVITGPEAFDRVIANGIGRHKAYGYGMLLLRPRRAAAATAA